MLTRPALIVMVCLGITGFIGQAGADSVTFGDYEIFFTTFKSTLIPADIAEAHGITRSDSRIILNIAIRKNGDPVRALIEGTCTNLLNQLTKLGFVEVVEESAVYYLVSQIVDERDMLRYSIDIRPEGQTTSYSLKFNREFYGSARQ